MDIEVERRAYILRLRELIRKHGPSKEAVEMLEVLDDLAPDGPAMKVLMALRGEPHP